MIEGKPMGSRELAFTAAVLICLLLPNAGDGAEDLSMCEKKFFDLVNLDYPGLGAVKQAVQEGDLDTAAAAFVQHMKERKTPVYHFDWRERKHSGTPAPKEKFEQANNACRNFVSGMPHVYPPHQFGERIEWGFNPTRDPEWTWQLNRMPFWHALAHAYTQTGDEEYAHTFTRQILDWINVNPPGTRHSWRTIEAGIRADGWFSHYFHFVDSPSFPPQAQIAMLYSLYEHGEYLMPESNFRGGSNWGLIETKGLAYLGILLPELKRSSDWINTALARLEGELTKQVHTDGAQIELTTSYHQMCISIFSGVTAFAERNGIKVSPVFDEKLEKMYEYDLYMIRPDGTAPMIGDSWPGDLRSVLKQGAEHTGRDDFLYAATEGREGKSPENTSYAFPVAGFHIMRTGWDRNARWLLMPCGPYGGWHSHFDKLSIIVYAFGKTLLDDSGSYLYYGPEREKFKAASAHSTLVLDGRTPGMVAATPLVWATGKCFDFAEGSLAWHDGLLHRRAIFFRKDHGGAGDYWIISDLATGKGTHDAKVYFQFSPTKLETLKDRLGVRSTNGDADLLVLAATDKDVQMSEQSGWISYQYNKRVPRPVICYEKHGEPPFIFDTVLTPFAGGKCPEVTIAVLALANQEGTPIPPAIGCGMEIIHGQQKDIYILFRTGAGKALQPFGFAGRAAMLRIEGGEFRGADAVEATLIEHASLKVECESALTFSLNHEGSGSFRFENLDGRGRVRLSGIGPGEKTVVHMQDHMRLVRVEGVSQAGETVSFPVEPNSVYLIGAPNHVLRPRLFVDRREVRAEGSKATKLTVRAVNFLPRTIKGKLHAKASDGLQLDPEMFAFELAPNAQAAWQLMATPEAAMGKRYHVVNITGSYEGRALDPAEILVIKPDEPLTGPIKIEGENFSSQGGGRVRIRDDKKAVSKKAFSHWDDKGHWLEWKFCVPKKALYKIVVRYCQELSSTTRRLTLDGKVPFPSLEELTVNGTGGWSNKTNDWQHLVLSDSNGRPLLFELDSGEHALRMTNISGGGMNIDYFLIMSADGHDRHV